LIVNWDPIGHVKPSNDPALALREVGTLLVIARPRDTLDPLQSFCILLGHAEMPPELDPQHERAEEEPTRSFFARDALASLRTAAL
jgi:hypothetical protein